MMLSADSLVGGLVLGASGGADVGTGAGGDAVASPNAFERFTELLLLGSIDLGIVAIGIGILLCLLRLVRGPTLIDRGVAADAISLQVVGLVVLLTVRLNSLVDFDAVLIVAILGFVSTVAFAQFIGRRGAAA